MSTSRDILKEDLDRYFLHTCDCINTIKDFILVRSSDWISSREEESKKLKKEQEPNSEENENTEENEDEETALEKLLEETLSGLEEMQLFLDAVEKLALTSRNIFEQNRVFQLPPGADLTSVQEIIFVSQLICPLLLSFRRDNAAFFKPRLENADVMQFQLNLYITNIRRICDSFRNSLLDDLPLDNITATLNEDIPDEETEKMLFNINKLNQFRTDEHCRLLFLFQDKHSLFMEAFKERKDMMLQFLSDIEACAVQLDSMNKGAMISSVVGSSVGVVSGILSIAGLALAPVTAGVSLGLVGAGAALGVTSGVNSVVTTVTEAVVNNKQKEKACETFEMFMEDVNNLQNILNNVIRQHFLNTEERFDMMNALPSGNTVSVVKSIDTIAEVVSTAKALGSEIPESVKGPLALSSVARRGVIAASAVFIGVDLFFIVKHSTALSKGSETEISKCLRATAALWKSEIDSWQKLYTSLERALTEPDEIQFILREPCFNGTDIC